MRTLRTLFNTIRLTPHLLIYRSHQNRHIIDLDIERWLEITRRDPKNGFVTLMARYPEFRNLFYKRIGKSSHFIKWLCPPMDTLYILTNDIGPGLFIQHGFATVIAAKSIGRNCWINQQVTIGYSTASDTPVIGDHVTVNAGAKIIGNLKMGDHSIAGANAVVVKNVPEHCTVVGVPAYIIKRNGLKVKEAL